MSYSDREGGRRKILGLMWRNATYDNGFFVDVCGMSNTAWQPGHFPFLPADDAGVLTKRLHCGQLNSIDGASVNF